MIIRKMTATFGTLEGKTLELKPGLNVIEAPNEWGKSTWCAFLRAMLYGIDTAQRAKQGQKPDKTLYAPWSGAPMTGSMELAWRGREITLRRDTRTPNAPLREFSAYYTGTAQPVPGLTRAEAGEMLTGVSEDVFRRTAFIGQAGLGVNAVPELEKKMAAILTSGEEDTSYTEAEKRLSEWQRRRRYRGRGQLPQLEEEIEALQKTQQEAEETVRRLEELEEQAGQARRQLEEEKSRLAQERERHLQAEREELDACRREARQLDREAGERERRAEALRQALAEPPFAGRAPDELAAQVREDTAAAAALAERAHKAPRTWPGTALLAAGALLAGGTGVLVFLDRPWLWTTLAGAILLAAGAWALLSAGKGRESCRRAGAESQAILGKYAAASPEELESRLTRYTRLFQQAEAAAQEAGRARLAAERCQEREELLYRRLAGTPSHGEAGALPRELGQRQAYLQTEWGRAKGRLDTLGDPLVTATRLKELEDRRSRAEREYAALSLALEELAAANAELQARFSPALARRTGQIMRRLTGGRVEEVTLARDLTALIRRPEDVQPHADAFFSRGTCDQYYLSLRLALCEMVLPEEEPCPLVLDDALVTFDDERMGLAMELFQKMGEKRQILLFTCQGRERRWLEAQQQGGSGFRG